MLAFGLSVLLFIFWTVAGYPAVTFLRRQSDPLQNVLLAPVVGLVITLLPVFWLNRLGNPVNSFGKVLALFLFLVSLALIWKIRLKLPWREYTPFTACFLLALYLTGRPMLEFGFNWVSYANDDMANYCLSADLFLRHGFFDTPDLDVLASGKDYTLYYWLMHVPGGVRPGCDLLLAWVCSVTGLTAHQVFMPTILAFLLILISTIGALVYQTKTLYLSALIACGLLSISALNTYGVLQQLIAQVSGIAILAGCLVLLLQSFENFKRGALIQQGLLAGLLVVALFIIYPEVLPFLVLAFLLYHGVSLLRRKLYLKPLLIVSSLAVLTNLVFLNTFFIHAIAFLRSQTGKGIILNDLQFSLFPYFLIPSGLAGFWSLQPISGTYRDPWISITILLGMFLLLTAIIVSFLLVRWNSPSATITLVMLSVGLVLFIRQSDFGLFKLAMFIQPFLVATMVVWWVNQPRQLILKIAPLLLVGLLSLNIQQNSYVEASRGLGQGVTIEVPNASRAKIYSEFQSLFESLPTQKFLLDTANVVLAKFQALYTVNKTAFFPSRDFYETIVKLGKLGLDAVPDPELSQAAQPVLKMISSIYQQAEFDLLDRQNPSARNSFIMIKQVGDLIAQANATLRNEQDLPFLISTTSQQDIFNNRRFRVADSRNFIAQPLWKVNNFLIFNHSTLGQHYYLGQVRAIALYQLEKDFFFPEEKMSGLGRHLLFETIHPSEQVRLELNLTASLKNDKENKLPPAEAIGSERKSFSIVGRGSAHVFSAPLSPQIINQRQYLEIDMGVEGKRLPNKRKGLMNWYGKEIPLDRRQLVGFGRDVSLISDEEYRNLNPPGHLADFPADLANPNLEYSGIYEDGWVSEAAFLNLKQTNPASPLVLQGALPELKDSAFSTELIILVEGQEAIRQMLKPGEFKIQLAVPPGNSRRRIDLRFSKFQRLPAGDDRPVAAQLKFIGFKENG